MYRFVYGLLYFATISTVLGFLAYVSLLIPDPSCCVTCRLIKANVPHMAYFLAY